MGERERDCEIPPSREKGKAEDVKRKREKVGGGNRLLEITKLYFLSLYCERLLCAEGSFSLTNRRYLPLPDLKWLQINGFARVWRAQNRLGQIAAKLKFK